MTVKKFKRKLKKQTIDDLTKILISRNSQYYYCLKLIWENNNPPFPEKDKHHEKYLKEKFN